ncbi:MAG: CobN component of cobalt chelatase involved in biosynthesis [Labilithrix sp.]|nr:CobN component of cobalt chelatase involved in biosynthesis [Labilithrix sp.]
MKAHLRVVCILACLTVPALEGCALEEEQGSGESAEQVAEGLTADTTVYADGAPGTGWASWSWSSTVGFANLDGPLAAGSASQIKVTMATSGGALSLAHAAGDLTASDYDAVTFDVRASAASTLRLGVETLAGGASGVQTTVPVTTSWTRQTAKLTALQGSLGSFGKINWGATQAGQTFYVDNVRLVPKTTSASGGTTFPSAPLTVQKNDVVTLSSSAGPYSLYVPSSYDATHHTATKLLVWLHGCGGNAYGDAWATSPGGSQSWISVSVGGRDGACWNMSTDATLALAALDDVKRRLNIDPRRVVIGGYSSGGNMAYRTAFYNAKRFAGVIAENTSPFYGTESSPSASIAAASWKLNVAHLAHVNDTTYPINPVRSETDTLKTSGFPTTRIERVGTHWDADTASSGTNYDMRSYLLGYLDAGWVAPQ